MTSFLHASTTAASSSTMLEQARRSTHDTARHVMTRTTRRACRVVTWHNKCNLGFCSRSSHRSGEDWGKSASQRPTSWPLSHAASSYTTDLKAPDTLNNNNVAVLSSA